LLNLIAADESQLFTELDGRSEGLHTKGAEIIDHIVSPQERLIQAIADPNTGYILLVLGALGIYLEFQAPGLIFPGVAGGILVLLGLSSLAVLQINWAGAALLALGMALFILEAKFISHGILGTGGAVDMVLGAVLLINGPPELRIRFSTAVAVSLPFAVIAMILMTLVIRSRASEYVMGQQALVNQIAQARTALSPAGTVFVHGEYWDAVSSAPVEQGEKVRVVGVDGIKLLVEPVGSTAHGLIGNRT